MTTRLSKETREKLDALKIHPRQSYDDVVLELIKESLLHSDVSEDKKIN